MSTASEVKEKLSALRSTAAATTGIEGDLTTQMEELMAGYGLDKNAVLYTSQTLTDEEKAQARTNIEAQTPPYYVTITADDTSSEHVCDRTVEEIESAYQEGREIICLLTMVEGGQELIFPLSSRISESEWHFGGFYHAKISETEWEHLPIIVNVRKNDSGETGVFYISNAHVSWKEFEDFQIEAADSLADKITTPETAEVGQTIVVKSVDENGKPTEWEAADLPEEFVQKKLVYKLTTTEQVDVLSIVLSEEQIAALENADRIVVKISLKKADEITTEDTTSGAVVIEWTPHHKTTLTSASPTGNVSYINYVDSLVLIDNGGGIAGYLNTLRVVQRTLVGQQNVNPSVTNPNQQLSTGALGVNYTTTITPAYPAGTGSYIEIYALCTPA